MSLTAGKITILNVWNTLDNVNLPFYIETANQLHNNQKFLLILHGSGGISDCEKLWANEALKRNYTIGWLDSFTPRGIYKLHHEKKNLNTFVRANDILLGLKCLTNNLHMFPWLNFNSFKVVGASHGGTVGLRLLTDRFKLEFSSIINKVYSLYPVVYPFESDFYTIQEDKLEIHVGEHDNWTPAKYCMVLKERVRGIDLFVHKNAHHGFSKPNSTGTWKDNPRSHSIDFYDPTPSDEIMNSVGVYQKKYLEGLESGKYYGDVYVEWNKKLTSKIIKRALD